MRRSIVLVMLALALMASACGDSDSDDASGEEAAGTTAPAAGDTTASTEGGTDEGTEAPAAISDTPLVIARDMDIATLDPSRSFCDTCQIYLSAVYETLIGLDPADNASFVPRLATEWEGNEDFTVYTFTLDPAAVFSDGSPVEAKDVAWSWIRLRDIDASASFLLGGIESIETPDAQTVVVTLAAPDSAFVAKANAPYTVVINSDVAIENGANADEDAETTDTAEPWFLENSAGSGPFMLDSFAEGDELRLVRNENFWRDGPYFEEAVIRQVQDAVTQRQLLETGEADIAMQIDPDTASSIDSPDVQIDFVDSFNYVYIGLAEGVGDVSLTREIREAIALAIDYEGMIDVTVGGFGNKQASPIPNGFSGTEGLTLPERDLEGARALLEQAGVPDGFSLRAAYPTFNVYGVDFNTMMQKVQIDLAEVGIDVQLEPLEVSVWVDEWLGEGKGIPLTAVYYAPDHTDPIQYVEYFGQVPEARWSISANPLGEPVIDDEQVRLSAEALAATGPEKEELYNQLAQAMIDHKIILPMVNPQLVLARRADIDGVHYSGCCNLELGRLSRTG
jgi:peptide/nickel transport system substrate-binding protein